MPNEPDDAARPYPLLRRFFRVGGPVFALFLLALAAGSVAAMRGAVEDVYLQIAERRASDLVAEVRDALPAAWAHLIDREHLAPADFDALADAFAKEVREARLDRLKVYDVEGRTLFSMIPAEIGKIENGQALQRVLGSQEPGLDTVIDRGGAAFYELYVPLLENGRLAAVVELYEPIDYLDGLILGAVAPAAIVPMVLLLLLILVLFQLARRAQRDIDWRTVRIADLTGRVERLVSRRAVQAMHSAEAGAPLEPRAFDCTLFFSDVRGFTLFYETVAPRDVIEQLNRVIALQVGILEEAGADVDKFIGDAVFARFEGPDRAAASIGAALAIQGRLTDRSIPLAIGIGIASGPVVAGVIGATGRYDYTVLGDPVNVASRLCSAAGPGEVVVDAATAAAAACAVGDRETIPVKGRAAAVDVVRIAARSAGEAASTTRPDAR